MTYLYIDDIRVPKTDKNWEIARTSKGAIDFMQKHGCPDYISFDFDLGGDDTALNVVKWMIEYDLTNPGFIPEDFEWGTHSANIVGRDNINGYLKSYLDQR